MKCSYFPGQFSDEYFVQFKGSEYPAVLLGGVFVTKENVIFSQNVESNKGLLKIIMVEKGEENSRILIPSITDSGTFFTVPNEEILDKS